MTSESAPFISIVIPTYNRPEQLRQCLVACAALDYPSDRFEVIVVDDGGAVRLDEIVRGVSTTIAVRLLRQENTGPAGARNRGVAEAKGDIVAFTDDDCVPGSGWLHTLASRMRASPDCAAGGRTINALSTNLCSTASQLLISYLNEYFNKVPDDATFFPSNNVAFPKQLFLSVGGFDVTYPRAAAEDRELCDRWRHWGLRMLYAHEAVVHHAHALTLSSFIRQHHSYGRGAYCFHCVRAARTGRSLKVEPLSFYLEMFRYPFSWGYGFKAVPLALLLGVAQAANAGGFFYEWWRNKLVERDRVLKRT